MYTLNDTSPFVKLFIWVFSFILFNLITKPRRYPGDTQQQKRGEREGGDTEPSPLCVFVGADELG